MQTSKNSRTVCKQISNSVLKTCQSLGFPLIPLISDRLSLTGPAGQGGTCSPKDGQQGWAAANPKTPDIFWESVEKVDLGILEVQNGSEHSAVVLDISNLSA